MCTARSLTVSNGICHGTHALSLQCMTPTKHAPLPCMPPPTHAPQACMPPTMYAPLPCMPPATHAPMTMHAPLPHMPPTMHAPCHTCPPATHTPKPCMPPGCAHAPCHTRPPAMQAPPCGQTHNLCKLSLRAVQMLNMCRCVKVQSINTFNDGPRIVVRRTPTPKEGFVNLLFCNFWPKTAWKWKYLSPLGSVKYVVTSRQGSWW